MLSLVSVIFPLTNPLGYENGEVVNRSYRGRRVIINKEVTDYMVKVEWDDGDYTWLDASEINAAVGKLSPIGYYTEEAYYA